MKPQRIQLRRIKGWRIPPNTIKVDRSGDWGNPFEEDVHGTQEECVKLFAAMLRGEFASGGVTVAEQQAYHTMAHRDRDQITGGAIQSDAAYAGDSRIDGDLAKWRRRNSATRRFWRFLRRTLVFASESYR